MEALEEVKAGITSLRKELEQLNRKYADEEVRIESYTVTTIYSCSPVQSRYREAETKLSEELATLTRYDNELKDLEATIKTKKQAIADTDLQLKQLERDLGTGVKEKQRLLNQADELERQHEFIQLDKG